MYTVYSLLSLVLFIVVLPYFVYQAIRYKKYGDTTTKTTSVSRLYTTYIGDAAIVE